MALSVMWLQDDKGDILPVHSISAGLDYPGVGPSTVTTIRIQVVQNM